MREVGRFLVAGGPKRRLTFRRAGIFAALAVGTAVAVLAYACALNVAGQQQRGSLSIGLSMPAAARTLAPAYEFSPASFRIECSGPNEAHVETTTTGTTVRFDALVLGNWDIVVTALDQDGIEIGQGSDTAILDTTDVSNIVIIVKPISGTGTLELTVEWLTAAAPNPEISAFLAPYSGDPITLSFSVDGSTATSATDSLPSGYYTLTIALLNSGQAIAGATEVVQIVRGLTTTGIIDFTEIEGESGTVSLTLQCESGEPCAVGIAGAQQEIGLGRTITLEPVLAPDEAGMKVGWYVDGQLTSTDRTAILGAGLAEGRHRIDLTAFAVGGERGGSFGFGIDVLADFPVGSISYSTMIRDGNDSVDGLYACHDVRVAPDGSAVYVAGYSDNAIAAFSRDADTGALTFIGRWKNGIGGVSGLGGVESLALSPDGIYLYAASYQDGAIVAFRRAADGRLDFIGAYASTLPDLSGLESVKDAVVSPDGKNLYCAGYGQNAIVAFSLDASAGIPSLLQSINAGDESGIAVPAAPSAVAITPDGTQLLAVGEDDDSLLIYPRDAATGLLGTPVRFADGVDGCSGMNGPCGVTVSPDGRNVYVAAYNGSSVAVFNRDPATGSVQYANFFKDGAGGVDALKYARQVEVSPDGLSVYVTGSADDAVAFFSRDTATGNLSYRFAVWQLDGTRGLSLSPDGKNCYVAVTNQNSLAVLNRTQQ